MVKSFEALGYKTDLQFMLDHEILVRTWPVRMLPNSPMNSPEYKRRYGLVVDERELVMATSSFTSDARAAMLRLRMVDVVCERLGLLRHLMRWMQWDHGVEATELMGHLLRIVDQTPERAPALSWVLRMFDLVPTVAVGWSQLFSEVEGILIDEFGVEYLDRLFGQLMPNDIVLVGAKTGMGKTELLTAIAAANAGYVNVMTGPGEALLVPPGDAEALARKVSSLLGDGTRHAALSDWGRAHAQQFDVASMAPAFEAVYSAALARHRSKLEGSGSR